MKNWFIFFLIFSFGSYYSKSDSIKNPTIWRQMSLYPDSNNYNLFFGGPGSIYRSINFNKKVLSSFDQHFLFSKEQKDLPFIKNLTPILDAQYIIGDELEQNLSIYHNQSISNRSYYALSFLKRSHDGYYSNQSTNHNYFQAHYYSHSLDSNYSLLVGLKHHRKYNQQNGGLENDSSFINSNDIISNRKILEVNMDHAYSNEKFWKFYINQNWRLKNKRDSSIYPSSKKILFCTSLEKKSRTYFDSLNADLFLYNFKNSLSSNDTFSIEVLSNSIYYNYSSITDSTSKIFNVGWFSQVLSQKNHSIDSLLTNQAFNVNYTISNNKNELHLESEYYFFGYKKNNYNHSISFTKKLSSSLILSILSEFKKYTPVLELNYFDSNHHKWDNNLNDIFLGYIDAALTIKSFKLRSEYYGINNAIYFKEYGIPSQLSSSVQIVKTSISNLVSKNKLTLLSELIYQYQGGARIFQLPNWIGQLKMNYLLLNKKNIFKIEAGINARAFSSYYLPNYLPEINQFSVSNNFLQNEYLIIDLLLKGTIQDVQVFAMLTHLNSGLLGNNYFSALHYPFPDRYLKFGLKWLFLN